MSLALLALGWLATPLVLRHVAFFRVRQIELLGVRNLSPDAVIAALRLPDEASVFSDTRMLADRGRGLAGVADARVVRRLPAAVPAGVKEAEPAAPRAGGCGRGGVGAVRRARRRRPPRVVVRRKPSAGA